MTDRPVDKASFAREYFAGLKAVMDRVDLGRVAAFVGELERPTGRTVRSSSSGTGAAPAPPPTWHATWRRPWLGRHPDRGSAASGSCR